MDAKASAKSKRSYHSHQGKKKPAPSPSPSPSPSPLLGAASGNKKKPLKQGRGQSSTAALPSNWDRYEEEFTYDAEVESAETDKNRRLDDVVRPKSKGADFAHLISQAQTESQARCPNPNPESFASFDDVLPGSIISARGKSPWSAKDNFDVDDNTASSYEALFLSLDLHAIAEQLAKVDLSKRLYIEVDMLPTELVSGGSAEGNGEGDVKSELSNVSVVQQGSAPLAFSGSVPAERNATGKNELMSSTAIGSDSSEACAGQSAIQRTRGKILSPTFDGHSSKQNLVNEPFNATDQIDYQDSLANTNLTAASDSKDKKTLRFEAAAAEAELDLLLNSIAETDILDSFGTDEKPRNAFSDSCDNSHMPITKGSSAYTGLQPTRLVHDSSKPVLGDISIDDALDGLLGEAPDTRNHKSSAYTKAEKTFPSAYASLQPTRQVPDSSKHVLGDITIDDVLDDLLGEAPTTTNQKPSAHTKAEKTVPSIAATCSDSKVLDDFDSWLDTI